MCQLDATSSTKLFFSWPLICKGQVWRLVTNFLYFGALDVHFLFHMYFLVSLDNTKMARFDWESSVLWLAARTYTKKVVADLDSWTAAGRLTE